MDDELQAQLAALIGDGLAASTRAHYARDLDYLAAWHAAHTGRALPWPAPAETVLRFAAAHLAGLPDPVAARLRDAGRKARPGPLRTTTVRRRLAAWAHEHVRRGLAGPFADPRLRLLLRRSARRDAPSTRLTPALSRAQLATLLAGCDDSLAGRRDAALLQLAYESGGRRRSELAALDVADLAPAGAGAWWLTVRTAKGATTPLTLPLRGAAAQAVTAWLVRAGHTDGALFRQVRRGGHLGGRLSGDGVADILARRYRAAGLTGLCAHSLRAGAITDAAERGLPLGTIMAGSGHRSLGACWRYVRVGQRQAL